MTYVTLLAAQGYPSACRRRRRVTRSGSSDSLQTFIKETCHPAPGRMILFKEFYERFYEWLSPEERYEWNKQKVSRNLPRETPSGGHSANVRYVGNLSWEAVNDPAARPLVLVNGMLRRLEVR